MKIVINNIIVDAVTIAGLAKICGRSTAYMRKAEERKILPEANFRSGDNKAGKPGYRLYSKALALRVAEVFKEFRAGVPATEGQKQRLRDLFSLERQKLKL